MALRHKSRRKPLFSLDALTDEPEGRLLAEEVIQTEERNRVLHFCMGEMNPDYREVLYLTYFEDMSYARSSSSDIYSAFPVRQFVVTSSQFIGELKYVSKSNGISSFGNRSKIKSIFIMLFVRIVSLIP